MDKYLFQILLIEDIWLQIKSLMYKSKKSHNYYQYRDGDTAAFYGYLHLIKRNNNLTFSNQSLDLAIRNGHLEIVEWLYFNQNRTCICNAINTAIEYGQLELIQWLYTNIDKRCHHHCFFYSEKCDIRKFAVTIACEKGYIKIIEWLQ